MVRCIPHTFIKSNKRFGVIFGGRMTGMQMDIDMLQRAGVAKNNDRSILASFNASQGSRQSANEHLVPEQMFDNPETEEKEADGISAVKALALTNQQGQTIYTITKDNYSEAIKKISLSRDSMQDIKNAVNTGKEVTAHARNINFNGWTGSGYIILDTSNGTGAYMISGGANGAVCYFFGVLYGSLLLFSLSKFDILDGHDFMENGVLKSTLRTQIAILLAIVLVSIVGIYQTYKNIYGKEASTCFALGIAGSLTVGATGIIKKVISNTLLYLIGIKGYIEGSDSPKNCFS